MHIAAVKFTSLSNSYQYIKWSQLLCLSALLLCSNYLAWVTSLYYHNCRYILTMTNYFTKYVETCPLLLKSADCVAKSLYQTFCHHGAPAHKVTDKGRQFVNHVSYTFDFISSLLTRLRFTLKLQLPISQITEGLN